MKLGEYLKARRESVDHFANRSGVGRATIFRIKKAGFAQSVSVIRKIVTACEGKVSWDELMAAAPKRKRRAA